MAVHNLGGEDLKLEKWVWKETAEVLGVLGIIAGIGFLGFEIRQNTRALQNESHQAILAILTDQQLALTTNDSLHRTIMAGEQSPFDVSDEEWSKFTEFMYVRLGVWEYLYLAKADEAITEAVWAAFDPYFLSLICKPGYRRWWDEHSVAFAADFRAYLDADVLLSCED